MPTHGRGLGTRPGPVLALFPRVTGSEPKSPHKPTPLSGSASALLRGERTPDQLANDPWGQLSLWDDVAGGRDHLDLAAAVHPQRVVRVALGQLMSSQMPCDKERPSPEERDGTTRATRREQALRRTSSRRLTPPGITGWPGIAAPGTRVYPPVFTHWTAVPQANTSNACRGPPHPWAIATRF